MPATTNKQQGRNPAVRIFQAQSLEGGGRQRVKKVLCYDPVVAIYLLVVVGWLVWLCYGLVHLIDNDDNDAEACATDSPIIASISCGLTYAMCVCCTISCAFICLR